MSYPFIGMSEVLPGGEKWDAKQIEKLLRYGGHHIYIGEGAELQTVSFEDGKFRIEGQFGDPAIYENEDFTEFMAYVLFFGQDFL